MKKDRVHHVGNQSSTDDMGRMTRFRAATMCGRLLAKPILITDDIKAVTCGSCRRVMGVIAAIGRKHTS